MMTSRIALAAALRSPRAASHRAANASARKYDHDRFEVGDIVTRGDGDRHRIVSITEDRFSMDVECIKAPHDSMPWCKVGEVESNLCRRYVYPHDLLIDEVAQKAP
jgi:hypothetical protein